MADLDLKLKVSAEIADAKAKLQQTVDSVKDVANKTAETGKATVEAAKSFYDFGASAALAMVNLSRSIISATGSLYQFAQSTLGLTVKLDTSNLGLKTAGFLIQNLRKEFTLSLGFLKSFADYLDKVNFPITPITNFINLMSKFNVVVGIGKGEKLFEKLKDDAAGLVEVVKKISLSEFKEDIGSAARSLALFAANTAATFTSLKKNISSESAFSEASRTITATDEQLQTLKQTIDEMSTVDLAVPTQELYAIAKAAGAAGKSAQDIPQFVRTVAEGVVALGIPAEELADKLGTIQSLLHLSEEQLVSFSDQVNTTADTLANVSEANIFEVMATGAASAGQQFGLLKGETIALSGTMVSLGAAPEIARTAIINLLGSLQNAKNQTPEFQQALAMMGTSAEKLAADIKANPQPTLLKLLETMNGFSKASRLDIADKLLGKGQDSVALTKLVDNTNLYKQALQQTADTAIYSGSVHDAYLKKLATEDSGLKILANSWDRFAISLTDTFLPAVKLITGAFTKFLNVLTEFSINHPVIKTFAAVTATVLSLGGAFRLLGVAMTLVGLSPAGLITKFTQLGAVLVSLNANLVATTASLFAMARGSSAFTVVKTAMSFLFGGTIGLAVGAIALLGIGIANLLPKTVQWGETTATVGEIIAAMWKTITDGFKPASDALKQGVTAIDDWLKSLGIADGLAGALKNSLDFIGVVVVNTGGLFKAFGETIGVVIGSAVESIAAFSDFTDAVFSGKGISDSLNTYLDRVKGNVDNVSASFKKIGEDSKNAVKDFEENTIKNLQKDQKTLAQKDTRTPDTGVDINAPADGKTAKQQSDAQDDLAKSERDREIQQIRDNEAEKIRLYTNTAVTQKQIDDFTFQAKINTENQIALLATQRLNAELAHLETKKQANADALANDLLIAQLEAQLKIAVADKDYELVAYTTQKIAERKQALHNETYKLTQEELIAKRTALIEIESAYKTNIGNLIALEKVHRDRAVGFANEIVEIHKTQGENNKKLDEIGLSSSDIYENKKREIAKNTSEIKRLLANGDYNHAAELGKKTQDLAFEVAKSSREAEVAASKRGMQEINSINTVVSKTGEFLGASGARETKIFVSNMGSSSDARKKYNDVIDLTTKALNGAKQAEIDMANKAKEEADKRKLSLDEVRKKIGEIEQAVQGGVELKVSADTSAVDSAKARIQQPTHSTHTIDVVENRVQAHSTGGLIYHYSSGGEVFTRKDGAISGKGTGTSDEIPAMLSNGEYVIKADKVNKYGVAALDAINYGSAPVAIAHYATGGLVGDDRIKQKTDELMKQRYEMAVAIFDDPRNQLLWRMDKGTTHTGSTDPNNQQKNFEYRVGEYLKANGLPQEWRDMYLKGVKAQDVLRNQKSSFAEKARAQVELEDQFAPKTATAKESPSSARPSLASPQIVSAPAPTLNFPSITPPNFSPVVPRGVTTPIQAQGKVSTVKFVAPDNKSVTGQFNDPNAADFFSKLDTISGVTRT